MSWKITSNNGTMYPPEVLVDDTTIALTSDVAIDAALPESCRVVGTIIYSADFSTIKQKNFDGEWVIVGG